MYELLVNVYKLVCIGIYEFSNISRFVCTIVLPLIVVLIVISACVCMSVTGVYSIVLVYSLKCVLIYPVFFFSNTFLQYYFNFLKLRL